MSKELQAPSVNPGVVETQGYMAAEDGMPLAHNPYRHWPELAEHWEKGYHAYNNRDP